MDFEDVDDDEHANESMQKMILTIAIGAGVIIFIILFYMIGSMLHLIPRIGAKATTTTTTQTKPVTDTQAEEKTVKVPDLYGKSKTEVEALLKKLSLKPVYKYELNVPDDRRDDKALIVTKQGVEKGTKLVRGSEVEVLMGWDPQATTQAKQVEVPALLDYTEEEAIELLKSKNLNVQKVYATSDTVAVGYIIKQSPTGGSIVDAGFTVTITISQGVGKTKVPTLYGMSKEAAEVELNKVDLFLGTVTGDYSASVGVGDVISQSVESGTQVDKGTKVSIVISLGERENFTYRGDVTVSDNPFEEGESGHVKLVLRQGDEKRTIYDRSVSSSSFPLNVNFEGMKEGDGTVVMYVDGNEYKQYSVSLTAMAN